jgi:SAM-dependent methyltransferase
MLDDVVDWRTINRLNWDERVPLHLKADSYDLTPLREGRGRLHPIEEAELGPVAGRRILHLQCHFGRDSLTLAQQGAEVVGLDFSGPAIQTARELAAELGLAGRARFVQADVYDTPTAVSEPGSFDIVFVTWGALCWLPDVRSWATIVARFLKPGGFLYLAEGHPAALVFDDEAAGPDGAPGRFMPYFQRAPLIIDDPRDYADPDVRLANSRTVEWMHPLGEVVTALLSAGLRLAWLHEHDRIPWRMFAELVEAEGGLYRWPDRPWLPLGYSLRAERPPG